MKSYSKNNEKQVGLLLKKYRKQSQLTQQAVANYLGLDRTTYTKYETVRNPDIDILLKLAGLYNISIETLIYEFFSDNVYGCSPIASASAPKEGRITEVFILEEDEKQLLYFYRDCIRKQDVIENARQICEEDNKE